MPRPKKEQKQEKEEVIVLQNNKLKTSRVKKATGKFDIFAELDSEDNDLKTKAEASAAFKTFTEIGREYLPVPWMAFQYMIGRIGIAVRTFTEIIGEECTGKSSLVLALAFNFIKENIPVLYVNTEPKLLEGEWLNRLAGENRKLGEKLIKALRIVEFCPTYDQMDSVVREWISEMRCERNIPYDTPLVFIVDSITNLMSPDEAEDKVNAKATSSKDREKLLAKGVTDISGRMGAAASWMSKWVKQFSSTLHDFNVTGIIVSGQSTNMNSGPAMSALSGDGGKSLNKTRIGGTALHKTAALQFTVTRREMLKLSDGEHIGDKIRARNVKNSYGPRTGDIVYNLKNKKWKDGLNTIEQAIDMSTALADILVKEKLFGMTVSRKKYSSKELNIEAADASEVERIIMSDESLQQRIGLALGISGYEAIDPEDNISESAMEEQNTGAQQ